MQLPLSSRFLGAKPGALSSLPIHPSLGRSGRLHHHVIECESATRTTLRFTSDRVHGVLNDNLTSVEMISSAGTRVEMKAPIFGRPSGDGFTRRQRSCLTNGPAR